jgi:hypothetical protein
MTDELESRPPDPGPDGAPEAEDLDTEGHNFVNPAVYADLARQRQKELEQDARRARPTKHEPTEKKRRWPFG